MARIRTIKPDFFRHELLQDLEISHPGMYPMMVFAALWGHCDSQGVFIFKPRQLKLDILPFLNFEMEKTLQILVDAEPINRYSVDGKEYGKIESFLRHQRLSGKEVTNGEKFPDVDCEATGKQLGSTGEAPGKHSSSIGEIPESQEGKGMEWNMSDESECVAVLEYLNVKTGSSFRAVPANLKLIAARIKEGASIADCQAVIDAKLADWSDQTNMKKYLRPATLFNAEKFAQYVGEIGTKVKGDEWE